ncbi:LOW QUALITY PROTEIN: uncharacterized protein LOC126796869 [Argentina anserina]|uniref:LOW QUALITY PROTEIN: uncharacterized protein LOC126796869 n=1 Tax=Argentina anserina TaxID=57926 RepID=UPI00217637B1|nr:LOW QUALITY PROTEIN: uncharacterized protein LOC126796869 [Potentilla anserina]
MATPYHSLSTITTSIVILSLLVLSDARDNVPRHGGVIGLNMIHRDAPSSPFYNASLTKWQRVSNALRRSHDHINHLFPSEAESSDHLIYRPGPGSGYGEYLLNISIGTPPRPFIGIVDTGSDITWTQCMPCIECFKQYLPIFDPAASSTYRVLSCMSDECKLVNEAAPCSSNSSFCVYEASYGDGSYSTGNLSLDTVTVDSTSIPNTIFSCGHHNGGQFTGIESGIVGLGRGNASFISQIGEFVGGKYFSYCLDPSPISSSKIYFGRLNTSSGAEVLTTPLLTYGYIASRYYLELQGISVGATRYNATHDDEDDPDGSRAFKGNIIIDSGTTLTYLPETLYDDFESAIREELKDRDLKVMQNPTISSLCYLTRYDILPGPNVTFHFNGADVKLKYGNIFVRVDDETVCLAFSSGSYTGIYGNFAQANFLEPQKSLFEIRPWLPTSSLFRQTLAVVSISNLNSYLIVSKPHLSRPLLASKSRVSAPVVRAGIAAIRPGGAVESDRLSSDVRKRPMEAVDACGRRVTVGDVAGRAGLKLNEAEKALQALASDAHGFLEASDEGNVLYVFPEDYRARLVANSFILRVEPLLQMAKDVGEDLARVAFGTALISSIILVWTAIIVALLALASSGEGSKSNSSDVDGNSGGGGDFDFSVNSSSQGSGSCVNDVFWYWDPSYYRKRQGQRKTDAGELKFDESVFSFVFGDSDPNTGVEERRWKTIGHYISSNGGGVAAEELASYLDIETSGETPAHDAYILPVLSRFEGQPLIDEEGNILYQFPSLQHTAKTRTVTPSVRKSGKFLREKWKFSKTSISKRAMVVGVGALNLCGVIILRDLLKDPVVAQDAFIKFITSIFPVLQIYAGFFFLIPLLHWFVLLKTNAGLKKKNQARLQFARDIESLNPSVRQKLRSAREMTQRTVIGQDKIVYTSSKDLVEQELDWRSRKIDK